MDIIAVVIGAFILCLYVWHSTRKGSKQVDEMLHTMQGAAYDACQDDEPTTDYDAEAVRRLLNSW